MTAFTDRHGASHELPAPDAVLKGVANLLVGVCGALGLGFGCARGGWAGLGGSQASKQASNRGKVGS